MKVQDLMTRDVRTCKPTDPVAVAAKIMADVNCGAVPVVDEQNRVLGILTDRDIVLRGVAPDKDVRNITCGECMTKPVTTSTPDMDAHKAADLMAGKQIRRLPVVQGDKLVGIVALGDMATKQIHVNEAGEALSRISTPSQPYSH